MRIKKYICFFLALVALSKSNAQGAILGPPAFPPHVPLNNNYVQGPVVFTQEIRDPVGNLIDYHEQLILNAFNNLRNLYAVGAPNFPMLAEDDAIEDLELEIFSPRAPLPRFNSQSLLGVLRSINNDIAAFLNANNPELHPHHNPMFYAHLKNKLGTILSELKSRYSLEKIEDAINNNRGRSGSSVLNPLAVPQANAFYIIPHGPVANQPLFRNTIKNLIGRIFVVKGDKIIGTSSGMIIPRTTGAALIYDKIITACHSMVTFFDHRPDIEFYFVRSTALGPSTGLPPPDHIAAVLGAGGNIAANVNQGDFVTYLRYHNNPANHTNNVRLHTTRHFLRDAG